MTAYTADDRDKMLLRMPAELKSRVRELSDARGISMTAMFAIVIADGIEVQELLWDQRNAAVAIVAASGGLGRGRG